MYSCDNTRFLDNLSHLYNSIFLLSILMPRHVLVELPHPTCACECSTTPKYNVRVTGAFFLPKLGLSQLQVYISTSIIPIYIVYASNHNYVHITSFTGSQIGMW